jgi:hypothetical protein
MKRFKHELKCCRTRSECPERRCDSAGGDAKVQGEMRKCRREQRWRGETSVKAVSDSLSLIRDLWERRS